MRARLVIAALLAGVAAVTLTARQSPLPDAAALKPQVERLMARYLADAEVVGVSVGVERGTDVLVRGGWGLADRAAKLPATAETTFRLGSTSKQLTAALVMRLVERGSVTLDDPVDRHLPQLPRKWLGITVRQMLNHTSGVPNHTATGSSHWPKTLPPAGLIALVADDGLHFKPGSKYEYSNTNYVLLALIAERYYAMPFAQILQDEIFKPLGMKTSRFCEDQYGSNGQARPYTRDGGKIEDAPYRSVGHSYGAGGICSTVAEVAIWNRALHGGKVVNAASYELMTTPEGAALADRYGFGLTVRPIAGRRALVHGGGVPGFITVNSWLPGDNISVTILVNTTPTPQTSALYRDMVRLALGQTVTIFDPLPEPAPNAESLRKYAGTYVIDVPGNPLEMKFRVDGKVLKGQATGQGETLMRPVGEHAFGTANDWTARFGFVLENGVVRGFNFEQAGQKFVATRKK